jgi:hypothetical protein
LTFQISQEVHGKPHDINLEKGGNTQVLEVTEIKEEMPLKVK